MAGIVKILDLNGLSYLYTKLRNEIDDFQATSKSVIDEAAAKANTAADRANAVFGSVDDTFLKQTDAESTYLSKDDASSTYQTQSDTESLYLKKTDAASTYQTKSDTDTNYLKKTVAESTYLSKTDAASAYLSQSSASSTYQTKSDANTNYLKKTDASSTYLSKTDASSTYQTKSDAGSNYLKKTDASSTYATKQALNDAIAGVTSISYSVVSSLPASGSDGVIYLVPKTSTENNNSYYEYIWIKSTSKFEKIGDTTVDLSGYLKSETAANTYLKKTDASNTYATKTSIPTKLSQLTNDSGYKTTDNNTTYTLTQDSTDGHKLTFAGSDGSSKTVTIPDNNTTYSAATTSAAGLMSASDKSKLDGITAGANAYKLPAATASALGGVKVGSNITNSSGTISLTKANVTAALGYTPPTKDTDTHYASGTVVNNSNTATSNTSSALTNGNVYLNHIENGAVKNSHKISGSGATSVTTDASGNIVISSTNTTYSSATQSAAGLMSAADKKKLDGVAAGANAYKLPAATASALGGVKVGSNITNSSGTISLTKDNVTAALGYTPPTTNTTYGVATTSANGLMSSTDKSKLDGITIADYLKKTDAASTYLGKTATAAAATKLATARTIALSGAVSGSASFDGTGNITINTSVQAGTSAPSSLANGAIYCVYEA